MRFTNRTTHPKQIHQQSGGSPGQRPRAGGGVAWFVTLTAVALLGCTHRGAGPAAARANDLVLADQGQARAVIVAPAEMDDLVQASVDDLAHYLGKMSGTGFEIVETLPADDLRTPIYIGKTAETVFGPVGAGLAGRFGFRVVAGERGIGLYGEAADGTSYAIYELLHRLGCRWFMPSEMGEVIPDRPTIAVSPMDESRVPATLYRQIQSRTADRDFLRRNRMGGLGIASHHGLERYYISRAQLDENPEWNMHIDGVRQPGWLRFTREDVAHAIADSVIKRLDASYQNSITLSPRDRVVPTEDPEERKHDPEPRVWEPAAGRWSVTDRIYMMANRVAERVGEKYPDVLFGVLAYINYNLPPAREPVHPNVIPDIAPIDFNRHHPMTWENHPNEFWLLDAVKGWAAKTDRLSYYAYGMNLAEITAPCPFITKWGTDIPILLDHNIVFWSPETMGGWESMMPGYYLSIRMTFDREEQPEDILDDLWTKFYGAAAEPMAAYWHLIDRAWIEAEEYSGAGFGYLRMFTPEIMREARTLIERAKTLCATEAERERVAIIDESLTLFELFMKMREDFAAARLVDLGNDIARWNAELERLKEAYKSQYAFCSGLAARYVNRFYGSAYEDAARMEAEYERLGEPMLEWKYRHNPDAEEVSLVWTAVDYDDADWPTTHIVRETWSSIGHHNSLTDEPSGRSGRMVYRAAQHLDELPEGKRLYLWLGSTDGFAKLFVNGHHVPWQVDDEGNERIFRSYCRATKFDVTEYLKEGDNQFAFLCERVRLNELGTGGLMGPVVLFRGE